MLNTNISLMENKNNTLKTDAELKNDELMKNLVLSTCVSCEQQLRLLQLRLISFDDLIKGVTETITTTKVELDRLESIKPAKGEKTEK